MRKLSRFQKIVFVANIFFAALLLASYFVQYVPVRYIPSLSFLALLVYYLLLINAFFLVYWILLKRRFFSLISLSVILLSFIFFDPYFKLTQGERHDIQNIKILSYNVRAFDLYDWIPEQGTGDQIVDFTLGINPDVLIFQEFDYRRSKDFKSYPYKFVNYIFRDGNKYVVQAIFSKYPIINKGALNFPNTTNNSIYVDLLYNMDTIRIYNAHLQSLRLYPSVIASENSGRLLKRLNTTFVKQEEQVTILNEHLSQVEYPTVICGDLNNTPFSRIYKLLKGDMFDTFSEAGSGFGRTYSLIGMPFRIDYIFADQSFEVLDHQNFDVELSDHYPIMATLKLKPQE